MGEEEEKSCHQWSRMGGVMGGNWKPLTENGNGRHQYGKKIPRENQALGW
jgi:hypothetical protein